MTLLQVFVACCSLAVITNGASLRNFGDTAGSVDRTIISGASGEETVRACLDKLDYLDVFSNDYGFLTRIARIESNFGTDYTALDPNLGIWQIPSLTIPFIQANVLDSAIASPLSRIRSYYGESFVDFGNFDLRIPFHSAIVVRLYLTLSLNSTSFPGGVADQGQWWSDHYHVGGDVTSFIATINAFEFSKECPSKEMDIWFLLDVSSSVGDKHFQTSMQFIRELSKKFQISSTSVRTGMSTFSSGFTTISDFNQHQSNVGFETAVNSTVYDRGRTYTGAALMQVTANGFNVANGARPYSQMVPRILILLTDGYSSDAVADAATQSESVGITTFAVGIGLGIKTEEINLIASYPSSIHSYTLENYDDLTSILVERFATELCNVPAFVPVTTSTQISVPFTPDKFFSIRIETYTSTSISISGISGSGIVYLSTLPFPSSILNLDAIHIASGGQTSLIANARQASVKSASSTQLSITGFDSSGYDFPLYVSLDPQTSTGMTILLSATTTTTTSTTTTSSGIFVDSVQLSSLEWWAILLIVLSVVVGIVVFGFVGLLILGISRSSKYPACNESCVSSFCVCFVQSAAY